MNEYSQQEREILLKLARDAIEYGLKHHNQMQVDLKKFSAHLCEKRACFVTLQIGKQLRGCIGSLEAHQPLVYDVVYNAYASAFHDPRFPKLVMEELAKLSIHISVLSKPEPMRFNSETDLLRQIRPEIDGLILSDGPYKGTFLPSVWESLPDAKQFLTNLKMKAGLAPDYWSGTLQVARYTAESIKEE